MSEELRAFIGSFKRGSGYTWIANNFNSLSKSELATIIKELIYGIEQHTGKVEAVEIYNNIADEIENWE